MKTANKSKIKQGVIAKIIISFVLLFLTGLGSLVYLVNRTDDLTLYPNLRGERVEMFIKNDKATLSIIDGFLRDKKIIIDVVIKISPKRKITKHLKIEDFDFAQKSCPTKWECPVYIMSKDKFYKEVLKK